MTKIQAGLTGCSQNSNFIFVSLFVMKPIQVGVLLPLFLHETWAGPSASVDIQR